MMSPRRKILRNRWVLGLSLATVVSVCGWHFHRLPAGTWEQWIASVPASTLLIALATLPMFGFPISVLHIATGARFGLLGGAGAVAATTVVHLGGGYLLARCVGGPVRRLLAACGWTLRPVNPSAAWPFAIWIALLPGVSYALKNLIAPLADVRWRVFIGATLPVHVGTAFIGLALGRATVRFSWNLAILITAYAAILIFLTRYVIRLLRASTANLARATDVEITPDPDRSPVAGDRT